MTLASAARGRARASVAAPRLSPPVNWDKWSVIVAVLAALNLVGGVAAFAKVQADLENFRAEVPRGSIQLLTERTEQIQKSLERIEGKAK